mgnify:CR=1 FL=1
MDWSLHVCLLGSVPLTADKTVTAAALAAASKIYSNNTSSSNSRMSSAANNATVAVAVPGGSVGQNLLTITAAKDAVTAAAWSPRHPAAFAAADATGRLNFFDLLRDTEAPVTGITIRELTSTGGNTTAGTTGTDNNNNNNNSVVSALAVGAMAKALGLGPSASASGLTSSASAAAGGLTSDGAAQGVNRIEWSTDGAHLAVGTTAGALHIVAVGGSLLKVVPKASERLSALKLRLASGAAAAAAAEAEADALAAAAAAAGGATERKEDTPIAA